MRPTWLAVIVALGLGLIIGATLAASILQATFAQLLNN